MAWLGVYPALPIQLAKLGGGGNVAMLHQNAFSELRPRNWRGREKGCSLATYT